MTIEEKAHAYDEAFERAKSLLSENKLGNAWLKAVFPELPESEDEKIRQLLIGLIRDYNWLRVQSGFKSATKEEVLAWLEKQKAFDTTPAEWNDYKDKPIEVWNAYIHGKAVGIEIGKKQKGQKPTEWSEEDEKMYQSALWHIKNSCGNGGKNSGEFEVYNWLKSLRPSNDIVDHFPIT